MTKANPHKIVLSRHITEKAMVLAGLEESESNACTKRCDTPKAVFVVDPRASKRQIAEAVEEIYRDQKVKVVKVNTVNVKRKRRRVRRFQGFKPGYKKAIVSFEAGDKIEAV